MPAYLVANVTVTDPDTYKTYQAGVPDAIARHGGRFLVRGGEVDVKEGDPKLGRTVIVEFPTMEKAQAFYNSDEYQALVKIRQSASEGTLFFVEGA